MFSSITNSTLNTAIRINFLQHKSVKSLLTLFFSLERERERERERENEKGRGRDRRRERVTGSEVGFVLAAESLM